MKKNRNNTLYFPAVSIIAAVILLFGIIAVSTYRNLKRYEKNLLEYTNRQGLTVLQALEAGSRSGLMMHMWGQDYLGSLDSGTVAKRGRRLHLPFR